MNNELIVWLVSLAAVFLVGWAWGRSGRRVVVIPTRDNRTTRVTAGHADDAQEEAP